MYDGDVASEATDPKEAQNPPAVSATSRIILIIDIVNLSKINARRHSERAKIKHLMDTENMKTETSTSCGDDQPCTVLVQFLRDLLLLVLLV